MGDVTRLFGEVPEELEAVRNELRILVGDLTHLVLGFFRERGLGLGERLTLAGGDPLELLVVFAAALRALADGIEAPGLESFDD